MRDPGRKAPGAPVRRMTVQREGFMGPPGHGRRGQKSRRGGACTPISG
jgi:hypothetical protein